MRLLVDYRPALRARTGVGEWIHNLVRSVLAVSAPGARSAGAADLSLFVSSWKDRPAPEALTELAGAHFIDRRIPVRALTWAWNRLGWPPVELLAWDQPPAIAFSPTPLQLPSRAPVRVVTLHDFDFLDHPERTWGEMKRDFPALIQRSVAGADLVVTISHFTAREAVRRLSLPEDRLVVVRPGVPDWIEKGGQAPFPPPDMAKRGPGPLFGGYILFVGTLEPRKNALGLIEAYRRLVRRLPEAPRLVLAGGIPDIAAETITQALATPVGSRIDAVGYVRPDDRLSVYSGASMLVLPSYMEGFGIPVLEAMALGIPVVTTERGALPEVAGQAALYADPDDHDGLAAAMHRVLTEPGLAASMRERGLEQARGFDWLSEASHMLDRFSAAAAKAGRP
jgi:glycosyltransferase involved in cell wall biosynthesis